MTAVRQWLESLGLGQYAEPFEIEEIEIADLRDLTEADLERLGLPMGPRKRLLRAIHATTAEPGGQTEARPNPKYAPAPLAAKILEARASIEGER
jgi:hypothetical protein